MGPSERVLTVWEAQSPYSKNATSKLNMKHWASPFWSRILWDRGGRLQGATLKGSRG